MTSSAAIPGTLPGSFSGGFLAQPFIKSTGPGCLPGNLPGSFSNFTSITPETGVGWEVRVRSFQEGLLAIVPNFEGLAFSKELNGEGAGEILISREDPIFQLPTFIGTPSTDIEDGNTIWEAYYNGQLIFQFLGNTIEDVEADSSSEEQIVKVGGPGAARVLKWAQTYSPGFPNVKYKLNALTDTFTSPALNTAIWNLTPTALIVAGTVGVDVTNSAAKVAGVQVVGAVGAPYITSSAYDATNSSLSAKVEVLGQSTAPTNLVQNSSFILGVQNWDSAAPTFWQNPGATLTAYGADSFDGDNASLLIVTDGSNPHEGAQQFIAGLLPHTSYTVTAWVKTLSGPATPLLQVRDITNSISAQNSSFVTAHSNTWTQVGTTITTGSRANVSLLISVNSGSVTTVSHYLIDDVACYQGSLNTFTAMTLYSNADVNNWVRIFVNWGSQFSARVVSNGYATDLPMGYYDPVLHAYWRIRESSNIFYFDTSPDSTIWTTRASWPRPWDATSVQVSLAAWWLGTQSGLAPAEFSSINNGGGTLDNQYVNTPNVGGVFLDLFNQAQARGWGSFVTPTFTKTQDSSGALWTDSISVDIAKGATLQDQLLASVAPINADWIMQPNFMLDVGLPGSLGTDKSSSVVFYESAHIDTKTRLRIRDSISNYIVIADSNGDLQLVEDAISIAQWGHREGYVELASTSDNASLVALGNAALRQYKDELEQRTIKVLPDSPGRTIFQDYDVGDWIGVQNTDMTAIIPVRVVAAAISVNSDNLVQLELTLVTRIELLIEQMNNLVQKIANPVQSVVANPVTPAAVRTASIHVTPAATSASYSQIVGDGITTAFNIVHNLNKQFVNYKIWQTASPYSELAASNYSATADSSNQLTVTFTVAPTLDQYSVVVS